MATSPSPWIDKRTGKRRGSTRWEKAQRLKILNHYKWVCQLCHTAINPRLPKGHPRSAEIHHLTPIAGYRLDGTCVPRHRACNSRTDRPWLDDPPVRGMTIW
jgi:hypothetical protein